MSEAGADGAITAADLVTEDERLVLKKVMTRIEAEVYHAVLRRMRTVLLLIGGVLTAFGLASFATIRSAAVDVAANRIAADTGIRDEVVTGATAKLQRVNAVLQQADELQSKIDREEARALAIVRSDLDRIANMTAQIQVELARRGR